MKTAETILNKYFPKPDDLVDGRVRDLVIKATFAALRCVGI